MGLRKLWALVGIGTVADGSRAAALPRASTAIRVVEEEITGIDPVARAVETHGRPARRRPARDRARRRLAARSRPWPRRARPRCLGVQRRPGGDGARYRASTVGASSSWSPAPRTPARRPRTSARSTSTGTCATGGFATRTDLGVVTLQPMLMPNAGRIGSEWMAGELDGAGDLEACWRARPSASKPGASCSPTDEEPFDLLIAVPPHRPPSVVEESGLLAGHGWIGVDPYTLATSHEGVYADRRRQPDPPRERATAPEGGRDGGAAGVARGAGRSRPSCAASAGAAAVRRSRVLPGRGRRGRGGVRAGRVVRASRSRSSGSTARARPTRPRSGPSRRSACSVGSAARSLNRGSGGRVSGRTPRLPRGRPPTSRARP